MDADRAIEMLKSERECLSRDCELYEAYTKAIRALEKKLPKVLRIRELKKLRANTVVWEERFNGRQAEKLVKPMIVSGDGTLVDGEGEIPIDDHVYDPFYKGRRRRFWNEKPTIRQRMETPWA